jgi:hypothetical protein
MAATPARRHLAGLALLPSKTNLDGPAHLRIWLLVHGFAVLLSAPQ